MAADLWQLANGWELVDWSLNVGGDAEVPTGGTPYRPAFRYSREEIDLRGNDDEALVLILALI